MTRTLYSLSRLVRDVWTSRVIILCSSVQIASALRCVGASRATLASADRLLYHCGAEHQGRGGGAAGAAGKARGGRAAARKAGKGREELSGECVRQPQHGSVCGPGAHGLAPVAGDQAPLGQQRV